MASWRDLDSVHYYFDESSYEKGHEFAAIAGLAVPSKFRGPIKQRLAKIKEDMHIGPTSEIKWKRTRKRRDCPQTAYAKYLKKLIDHRAVHLHIIFAPFGEWQHSANGGREGSVGRLFNELLIFKPFAFYGPWGAKLHFRPDEGGPTSKLGDHLLPAIAEAAGRERGGWKLANNISSCLGSFEPRSSKRTPLLQLLDVTLGAFASLRNGRPQEAPKTQLASTIFEMYDRPDICGNTDRERREFSIWNFEGRGARDTKV